MSLSENQNPSSEKKTPLRLPPLGNLRSIMGPLLALVCVLVFFAVADRIFADGTFSSPRNLRSVAVDTCVVAIAALGMTVVIISGGIDLSVGTAIALCATMLAWCAREDVAFICRYGDNFPSASRKYDHALDRLDAVRKSGETDEIEDWKRRVDWRRERLLRIANVKLYVAQNKASALESRVEVSRRAYAKLNEGIKKQKRQKKYRSLRNRQKAWLENATQLKSKIAMLDDYNLRTKSVNSWSNGIRNSSWSAFFAVAAGIATGLLAGFLNGLLIVSLRIVPFIATLGTMSIYLGIGRCISNNVTIRPSRENQIPNWIQHIISYSEEARWFGLFPASVFLLLLLAVLLAVILRYTVFGRYIFALGSNEATARLCGINVPRTKVLLYTLAGSFTGIASICFFSKSTTANPTAGMGIELSVIAAVVIGGGSLNGGRGSVLGTLAGAAIMQVIRSGSNQLGIPDQIQPIILGVVIVGAAMIDQVRQHRLEAS